MSIKQGIENILMLIVVDNMKQYDETDTLKTELGPLHVPVPDPW